MRYTALAVLLLAAQVQAQQWFSLSGPGTAPGATVVEVDLETVHRRESAADAVVRVTHDVLNAHPSGFGYRSFVATAAIDCVHRTIALESAAYFAQPAGNGPRVGADSSGRSRGMPGVIAERIPAQARHALLKAACPGGTP
ncbi:surface-adhesin E family protein [Ramlibacter albus]|uniref:Surface-adhesin protein E-like domain-containing protein n=1 Tax=Ramlibacter albus TaxID=2079448 RepID=A0A923S3X6_9BURK|nr:surface-adhesin E family protein [Ramlibacter albus]MBC5766910.1 hypothetical protein [Ramlibacter albus]